MSDDDRLLGSSGLKPALARFAGSLLALVQTRGQLAGLELVEERERLIARLALLLGGVLLLVFAVLFAGLFVVVLFWDTHRLWAIVGVGVAFLVAGAVMLSRAKGIGSEGPAPFAATLAEFEKDRAWLARIAPPPAREE
jgi:uncharacterized membrane protein YqjE